jgi:hypothetical protein
LLKNSTGYAIWTVCRQTENGIHCITIKIVALRRLCEFQRKPTTQGEKLIAGGKIVRDFFQVASTLVTKWVNLVVESVAASVVGALLKALNLCHFVDLPDVVIYEFAIVCPFDAVVVDLPIACVYRQQ